MRKYIVAVGIPIWMCLCLVATGTAVGKGSAIKQNSLIHERDLLSLAGFQQRQIDLLPMSQEALETRTDFFDHLSDMRRSKDVSAIFLLESDTSYEWLGGDWVGETRTTYTYGSYNLMMSYMEDTCSGGNWYHYVQVLLTYDTSARLSVYTIQSWEYDAWVNDSKTTVTYDSGDNWSEMLTQIWTDGEWVNGIRSSATFTFGRITAITSEMWQVGTSTWEYFYRVDYTYDDNGNLTEFVWQDWQNPEWVNSARYTTTYDGSGDELQTIAQTWLGNEWVNLSKNDYTHNDSHQTILDLYSLWMNTVWTMMTADSLKYAGDLLIEDVYVSLSTGAARRTQYTHDAHGNAILILEQKWDISGGTWLNISKTVSVYLSSICGDFDASGGVDIADAVRMVNYIFGGGPAPADIRHGDVDCDLAPSIADAVYLVNYIFSGGAAPCAACP